MRLSLYQRERGSKGRWRAIASAFTFQWIEPALRSAQESQRTNGWPYLLIDKDGLYGERSFRDATRPRVTCSGDCACEVKVDHAIHCQRCDRPFCGDCAAAYLDDMQHCCADLPVQELLRRLATGAEP